MTYQMPPHRNLIPINGIIESGKLSATLARQFIRDKMVIHLTPIVDIFYISTNQYPLEEIIEFFEIFLDETKNDYKGTLGPSIYVVSQKVSKDTLDFFKDSDLQKLIEFGAFFFPEEDVNLSEEQIGIKLKNRIEASGRKQDDYLRSIRGVANI